MTLTEPHEGDKAAAMETTRSFRIHPEEWETFDKAAKTTLGTTRGKALREFVRQTNDEYLTHDQAA